MKYGEAIAYRSVQEWLPYNIDYTEVKLLIKRFTYGRTPVSSPDRKTDFEDELFEVFLDQLNRIDLFVRSKAGEIARRIVNCERQVQELQKRKPTPRAAPKIANRYAKIEREIERGGHDIQLLSRFVSVQRTAFHKLLKKYKKWTGSAHLSDRFNVILESPTSFTQLDFENNVQDVSSILMAIRDGVDSLSDIPSAVQSYDTLGCDYSESFAAQTTESPLDMDCEFYAFDAAKRGGRAIFWVHSDHIIEVQVFLLKQLLLQSYLSCRGQPSKHSKFSKGSNVASPGNDEITTVVLENLEHISQVSSVDLEPMSQKKMKTAAHVQWCSGGTDAFVIASGNTGDVLKTTVKRKQVETLFDSQSEIFKSANNNTFEIRNWINKHPMVVPLVKILSKRTRFTGRATDSDIWAFLDRDVRIGTCKNIQGWATSNEVDQTLDITNFPYAILEIVWDGTQMPEFVQELTQHHIVEIMNGFSLQVYALVAIYGLKNIVPRCWHQMLEKDIRKTPTIVAQQNNQQDKQLIRTPSQTSSVAGGHISASIYPDPYSTAATSDGATMVGSLQKERRKSKRRDIKPLSSCRYWNEFDDGSEGDEPYTILVRPSSSSSSYGEGHIDQSLSSFIITPISQAFSRLRQLLQRKSQSRAPNEYTSLLGPPITTNTTPTESESDGDVRYGSMPVYHHRNHYISHPYPQPHHLSPHSPPKIGHITFLLFSLFLVVASGALAIVEMQMTSPSTPRHTRHKHRYNGQPYTAMDFSVLVGLALSLITGIIGLTIFLMSIDGTRRSVSWMHKAAVWTAFVVICAGSGAILMLVVATAEVDA